jgi:hypothetical protein
MEIACYFNNKGKVFYNGVVGDEVELSQVVEEGKKVYVGDHNTRGEGGVLDKLPKKTACL